ncbi:MAG TPA: acyloxyacyl hydrolase [Bacteroidia bacterium]|nr:acyloxyacyl hydrolase [Bacteroidia bacterium]
MKTLRAFVLSALLCSFSVRAQNGLTGHPEWIIKPAVDQTFIMVHRANLAHLVQGYPTALELNVAKPTLGNKLWQVENNLPYLGLTFLYMDFKNSKELGHAYSIAPYIEIPLRQEEKISRLYLRLCWGLTFLDKPFDVQSNHKNVAIGSGPNAFVQFKWFWQIPLGKQLRFEPGFTFMHCSNGRMENPNLGLNMMGLSAALHIQIPGRSKPVVDKVDSSTRAKSRWEVMSFAALGLNQRSMGGEHYGTFVYSAALQRNIRNTHKFSFGTDLFLDANYALDYQNQFGAMPTGLDQWRISLRAGYSYNVGRLSFPIEIGYYVFQKTNPDAMLVSRIGFRYYCANGLVAHFGLRTHFAVAYNFEFGLGYRIFIHAR